MVSATQLSMKAIDILSVEADDQLSWTNCRFGILTHAIKSKAA